MVIHSLDLGMLKNEDWLTYLSELATTGFIKFIISVESIKSTLIWREQALNNFNFFSF